MRFGLYRLALFSITQYLFSLGLSRAVSPFDTQYSGAIPDRWKEKRKRFLFLVKMKSVNKSVESLKLKKTQKMNYHNFNECYHHQTVMNTF